MIIKSFPARKVGDPFDGMVRIDVRSGGAYHRLLASQQVLQEVFQMESREFNLLVYESDGRLNVKASPQHNEVVRKAGVFLYNLGTREFLAVHASGSLYPYFTIPKGNIEGDDCSPLQAAFRELAEETSICFASDKNEAGIFPIGVIAYGKDITRHLIGFLKVINEPVNPPVKLCWENDGYQWLRLSKATEVLYLSQFPFIKEVDRIIKERYTERR